MPSYSKWEHPWAVLLAGGDSTRLQSLTVKIAGDSRPKQFCRIFGMTSLLGKTRERLRPVFRCHRRCIASAPTPPPRPRATRKRIRAQGLRLAPACFANPPPAPLTLALTANEAVAKKFSPDTATFACICLRIGLYKIGTMWVMVLATSGSKGSQWSKSGVTGN